MNAEKKPSKSLLDRILSTEGLLGLIGLLCLVYGIINGLVMAIFWGVVVIVGLTVLHQVRKKDWAAHWEEMDKLRRMREEQERRRKSEKP